MRTAEPGRHSKINSVVSGETPYDTSVKSLFSFFHGFDQVKATVVMEKFRIWLYGERVSVIPLYFVRQNEKLCIDQQENPFSKASF